MLQLSYLMCIKTLPLDSIVNGGSGNEVSYLLEGSRAGNESKVLLLQVSFYHPTAAPKVPDSSKVYSNSVNSSGHPHVILLKNTIKGSLWTVLIATHAKSSLC